MNIRSRMAVGLAATLVLVSACTTTVSTSSAGSTVSGKAPLSRISPRGPLSVEELHRRLVVAGDVGTGWTVSSTDQGFALGSLTGTEDTKSGSASSLDSTECAASKQIDAVASELRSSRQAGVSFDPPGQSGTSAQVDDFKMVGETLVTATPARVTDLYDSLVAALSACGVLNDTSTGAKAGGVAPYRLKSYGRDSTTFRIVLSVIATTVTVEVVVVRKDNVLMVLAVGGSTAPTDSDVIGLADRAASRAFAIPLAEAGSGTTAPPTTADPQATNCANDFGSASSDENRTTTTPPSLADLPAGVRSLLLTPDDLARFGGGPWKATYSFLDPTDSFEAAIAGTGTGASVELDPSDQLSGITETIAIAASSQDATRLFPKAVGAIDTAAKGLAKCQADPSVVSGFSASLTSASDPSGGDESQAWALKFSIVGLGPPPSGRNDSPAAGRLVVARKGRYMVELSVTPSPNASAATSDPAAILTLALNKL